MMNQPEDCVLEKTEIIPCKWRNMVFDKNGKTYYGKLLFNSDDEAVEHVNKLIVIGKTDNFVCINGKLSVKDYSWHMAIPELV